MVRHMPRKGEDHMTRSVRHLIAIVVLTVAGAGAFASTSPSHAAGTLMGGPLAKAASIVHV
jgi:hypothetical protein